MKKLLLIFCLAYQVGQAQQTSRDSALTAIQMELKHIHSNIQKSKDYFNTGIVLHVAGGWAQVIAITGYKQGYYDKATYKKVAIYSLALNVLGTGFTLYSRKFINRAALQVTPGGVKLKF